MWLLKTTDICFVQFLWVRNSGVASLRGPGLAPLLRLQARHQLGLQQSGIRLGWRICFQDFSLSCLLARGLSPSLVVGLLHRASWVSLQHGSWLCKSKWYKKAEGRHNVFYHLASEAAFHHFHHILWLHMSALFSVGGCEYQQRLLRWAAATEIIKMRWAPVQ